MDDHDFQAEHNVRFSLPAAMKNDKHFTIVIKLGKSESWSYVS